MRLLIVTQKADRDDDLLGFFHQWICEFAKHCDFVTVICLEEGTHNLPPNVRVFSLGKERCGKPEERPHLAEPRRFGRGGQGAALREFSTARRYANKTRYLSKFYEHIWRERKNYDTVFVHMNTEYMVLAGWLWRLMGKKVALWHAHFEINWRLRLAGLFAHVIFTTTKDGCRAWKRKVRAIGHGIDVARFATGNLWETQERSGLALLRRVRLRRKDGKRPDLAPSFPQIPQEPIRFLYAGKITPIKNVHVLVDAARILKESWDRKFIVDIVGPPTDSAYDKKLREYIAAKNLSDVVIMHGRAAYSEMPAYYARATAVVNMCPTGAMDKTVLEGLASRTLAVVANEAFRELFGEYADGLMYPYQKAEALAEKIKVLFSKSESELVRMREFLHKRIKAHSSLETRIPLIAGELKRLVENSRKVWPCPPEEGPPPAEGREKA